MADTKEALPRLPEPVAWRGLTQSYPYPQDNDWRYGPWVYDLDTAKYRRLFTEEQMHAFREAGVSELRAEVERQKAAAERLQGELLAQRSKLKLAEARVNSLLGRQYVTRQRD